MKPGNIDSSPYPQGMPSRKEFEAVKDSSNPAELIRVAYRHWHGIGWPEDAAPIALLERALLLLGSNETPRQPPIPSSDDADEHFRPGR